MLGTKITSSVFGDFVSTQHFTTHLRYFGGRYYRVITNRSNFAHKPIFKGTRPLVWSNIAISVHRDFGNSAITRFKLLTGLPYMEADNDLRALWDLHMSGDGVTEPLELEPPF